MDKPAITLYVGVDWADRKHDVRAISSDNALNKHRVFKHSAEGLCKMGQWLSELAGGCTEAVAVAIETKRGPVVETLLGYGFRVFHINPKQLDRFRDRFRVSGAKDDQLDAYVLAQSLRTDQALFQELEPEDDHVIRLRELVGIHGDVAQQARADANRLRDILVRTFPVLLEVANGADEPWLWALLDKAPTHAQAARLQQKTLAELLKSRRIRKIKVDELRALLQEPPLPMCDGTREAAASHIRFLLPRLWLARDQLARCERQIRGVLDEMIARHQDQEESDTVVATEGGPDESRELPSDVEIIQSMPGIGPLAAATFLTHATAALRSRDLAALRAQCGVAPVTRQSGKSRYVRRRRACSQTLANAAHIWALSAARTRLSRR